MAFASQKFKMKTSFIIVAASIVFGCAGDQKNSGDSQNKPVVKIDTNVGQPGFKTLDQIEHDRQLLLDSNYSFLGKMMDTILKAANQQLHKPYFSGEIDTSVFTYKELHATYEFGNIFSKNKRHLLVKRFLNEYDNYNSSAYSDIYLLEGGSLRKVVADTVIEASEISMEDVNCDGFTDYVVNYYSGAGCCPRSADNVYIYNPKNGKFIFYDFLNRISECDKKIMYETSYGYPQDIEVYKYKWVGLKCVLIESLGRTFISWDLKKNPKTYTKIIYPSEKEIVLKDVPEEYKRLSIYDYFKLK
jgi:hypothetical protein